MSPVNWDKIEAYIDANMGPFLVRLSMAVFVAIVVYVGARIAGRIVIRALHAKSQRAETIAPILRAVIVLSGTLAAIIMALAQLGIDVSTVLAGAGIIGLAIGFGAQTLVKDCISGFFLILEDIVEVGDLVDIDKIVGGRVEKVGLRVTKVREFNGKLWYIPNGSIASVGNFNRTFNRVVVDVGIAYEADAREALRVLDKVGAEWAAANPTQALEPPVAQGVLALADSAVMLRLVGKVAAGTAYVVERELRLRIKEAFDAASIEIPYPTSVQYERSAPDAEQARPATPDEPVTETSPR
ncbi:MAG: mechanosensitive ion channel family protein [Kofleriaceae bacterium]